MFLSHLESSETGKSHAGDQLATVCPDTGRPLIVRYDLDAAGRALSREE